MNRIWLQDYRCFRDSQEARLAPLTLLVGDNSTGKTSLLAMIRALCDVVFQRRVPNFKEQPYDLGSFDEIAHFRGGRSGRATSFTAGFETASGRSSMRWTLEFGKRGTAPVPVGRRLASAAGDLWVHHRHESGQLRLGTRRGSWEFDTSSDTVMEGDRLLPLYALLHGFTRPATKASPRMKERDRLAAIRLATSAELSARALPLYAGAPVRSKPHRTYDPALVTRDPEGDYIPMFLANQYFQDKENWLHLVEALERFGKDAGLFDEITVKPLGKQSGPFQLQIRRFDGPAKGPQRNLIDVGYGVSQVLPVVTELLRQDAPRMFLLQQPEVHLHPRAQAALGSLFCRIAGWDRQLVIETHSDHMLDRVRMDVRDRAGSLTPEDVSILYFERGRLDVRIHSLGIDGEGNITDASPSYRQFFMDEVKRSLWKQAV